MIAPTVGRVVWYWKDGIGQIKAGEQPCAAQVAYVHSDTLINIGYLDHNGHTHNATSVRLVQDEPITGDMQTPFCTWMPYQKAVATGQQAPTLHA